MPFHYPVAVKFSEIDHAGIVFNAHYLTWCEDAKFAYLDSVGFGPYWFAARGLVALVRHAEIDWVASLRPLEHADIRVSVDRLGTSSFTLRHEIWRAGPQPIRTATCVITYVWFDAAAGQKRPLDEGFRAALADASGPG
ncbi:MAG TPA: thioesterase family protein [Intrasporangium sp.]|uniref:acyl-CoA thioesterase n=1 Tax=Intrasporangium sp. TaxID=1925024 RepID=UPI002D781852|nr:thioesterase family protein [Intrasporangium sp.]HET7397960.1 thioesterase family protein [Intrasporangium sp.]